MRCLRYLENLALKSGNTVHGSSFAESSKVCRTGRTSCSAKVRAIPMCRLRCKRCARSASTADPCAVWPADVHNTTASRESSDYRSQLELRREGSPG